MSEEVDTNSDGRYADRYSVAYAVYGKTLDADALLATQTPVTRYELWHTGDIRGGTRRAVTSGIRIEVVEAATPMDAVKAIESFLVQEQAFVHAAALHARDDVRCALSCAMSVYAKVPSTISLHPHVLRLLSEYGVDWEVTGYPCADDDGP